MTDDPGQQSRILVSDLFVRVFHWSLVLAVSGAGLTGFLPGATWLQIHNWSGAAAAALILIGLHFLDAAVFKVKPIYSLSNCAACHADAESGR